MLIKEKLFVLGITPNQKVLREAEYSLTLDGRKASLEEIRDLWKKERESVKFWGRSERLIEQAMYWETDEQLRAQDPEMADKLLKEAGKWKQAEEKAIAEQINPRIGGGINPHFEKTRPWQEFDKLKQLESYGERVALMDHPIVAVSWILGGWKVELGEGKRGDVQGAWGFAAWAIDAAKQMLDNFKFRVDHECSPEQFDQRNYARLRTYLNFNPNKPGQWKRKQFYFKGLILEF